MSILELVNVTKKFGGLSALHGVSLQIEEGEIVGLIGPNGAGNVPVAILQYQQGKVQEVWPPEFKTADLVFPTPPYDQRK